MSEIVASDPVFGQGLLWPEALAPGEALGSTGEMNPLVITILALGDVVGIAIDVIVGGGNRRGG